MDQGLLFTFLRTAVTATCTRYRMVGHAVVDAGGRVVLPKVRPTVPQQAIDFTCPAESRPFVCTHPPLTLCCRAITVEFAGVSDKMRTVVGESESRGVVPQAERAPDPTPIPFVELKHLTPIICQAQWLVGGEATPPVLRWSLCQLRGPLTHA